jgi:hypothetical protein
VYMWVPVVACGVMGLVREVIAWRARVSYERVRAMSIVDVLRAASGRAIVCDRRRDGTELHINIPASEELRGRGADGSSAGPDC